MSAAIQPQQPQPQPQQQQQQQQPPALSQAQQLAAQSRAEGLENEDQGLLLDNGEADVEAVISEKNQLIGRQYVEIERLQRELAEVINERDALLCEVSKFKFECEMADLKRLQDDCLR
ncbi:hypothetical protein TKK_0006322 [Trichogramma kaykai]